jgi:hypothetical protein
LPVFGTVKLGVHRTPFSYLKALDRRYTSVHPVAYEMFTHQPIAEAPIELDLVKVPHAITGLEDLVSPDEVLNWGLKRNLAPCPFEVAFALGIDELPDPGQVFYVVTEEDATTPGSTLSWDFPKDICPRPLYERGRRGNNYGLLEWADRPKEDDPLGNSDTKYWALPGEHYWGRPGLWIQDGVPHIGVLGKKQKEQVGPAPTATYLKKTYPFGSLEFIFIQTKE